MMNYFYEAITSNFNSAVEYMFPGQMPTEEDLYIDEESVPVI